MLYPDQICEARHTLSLSQHELARRACVSRTALNQFERGNYSAGPNFSRKLRDYFEAEGIHLEASSEPQTTKVGDQGQPTGDATEARTAASSDWRRPESPSKRAPSPVEILIGVGLSLLLGRRIGL
ncbi:helix-turn-helix domain-containing protein [Haliea salexigens]|uniref:helix-turn-helix domain-containing protein n=1 Tax=Haliea salexigens TaxID=287487 RepID=UPI00130DE0B3